MTEKAPLSHKLCAFRGLKFETSAEVIQIILSEKLLLSRKLYVTSEAAASHNILYYQQLPIACYQVSFYANNYFE